MRSLLFVPGNSAKMIAKAEASGADVIILDLEDAVHPDARPEARRVIVEVNAAVPHLREVTPAVERAKACARVLLQGLH